MAANTRGSRSTPARIGETLAILVAFIGLLAFFRTYAVTTAGGSDSYGYVSEALLLDQGRLSEPERVLSPFGLAENSDITHPLAYASRGPDDLVPTYPFGYPLFLAAAMRVGGFAAAFWVTPLFAAGTVILTYVLARTWLGWTGGVIAGLLTALLPNFVWSSFQVISDVPATFFSALALVALFRPKPRPWHDVLLAGSIGVEVWIRPNVSIILIPVVAWLVWRQDWWRIARFGVALLPFAAGEGFLDLQLYGAPWTTGYGALSLDHNLASAGARAVRHLRRLQDQQAQVGIPLGLLGFLFGRLTWPRRFALAGAAAVFLAFFAFYPIDDAWWYGRFLLPGFPAVATLEAAVLVRALQPGRLWQLRGSAVAIGLAAFAVVSVSYAQSRSVFQGAQGELSYAVTARFARQHVHQPALVLAMQHSGTLRLYGGLDTMRYDIAPVPELLSILHHVAQNGGSVYLLGDSWEVATIEQGDRSLLLAGAKEIGRVEPRDATLFALDPPFEPRDLQAQHPAHAQFGDNVSFLGFDASSSTVHPGDTLALTLYWEATSHPRFKYTVFVHLENSEHQVVTQSDSYPVEGRYPTSEWTPGYVVADVRHLTVPPNAATGTLQLVAGLYRVETLQRLSIRDATGKPIGDHLVLGDVSVRPR